MKDNMQNIVDLIGALAEDIEEIKKKLEAKDTSDKDEAAKRLSVKLEPIIRFFGSSTPKNISEIFGSRESIENYKKSLSSEMIVGMQAYTVANEKNMREHGMLTVSEMLHKILEMQTTLADNQKTPVGIAQQKHGFWQIIRPNKAMKIIKRIWNKIPNGWYKNPYIWTGVVSLLVYTALFAASWMKWHEFRDENRLLKTVAAKHEITSVMLKELYPELAVTVGAYEELVDAVGVDSTLTVFQRQMKKIRPPKKK